MIDPRELRIGNYVSANINDILRNIEIHAITTGGVSEYGGLKEPENPQSTYDRKWINIDDINPIPLTEDILLICGFRKLPYGEYRLEHFLYRLEHCSVQDLKYHETEVFYDDVSYLHELQNLFYALKTELNVQL